MTTARATALACAAALLATACNAEKGANASGKGAEVTAAAVPAPNNGDWSAVVSKTPEGEQPELTEGPTRAAGITPAQQIAEGSGHA